MKLSEFYAEVRRQIKDSVGTPRWDNATLVVYLNQAIAWMWKIHPEAFALEEIIVELPAPLNATDLDTDIPIDPLYIEQVMHYVCALVLGEDREAAANAQVSDSHKADAWRGAQ
jgi:hypothetical protein